MTENPICPSCKSSNTRLISASVGSAFCWDCTHDWSIFEEAREVLKCKEYTKEGLP